MRKLHIVLIIWSIIYIGFNIWIASFNFGDGYIESVFIEALVWSIPVVIIPYIILHLIVEKISRWRKRK